MAIDHMKSPLSDFFASHKIPRLIAPFSDAHILQQKNIDNVCLFTCTDGFDFRGDLLSRSHTMADSLEHISLSDMEDFREKLIEMLNELKGENCGSDLPRQASRTV